MRASLIAVGTGMPQWVDAGTAEYRRRLSHWLPLDLVEIAPGDRARSRDPRRAIAEEGQRLIAAIPKDAWVVLCDARGKSHSSESLAQRLQHWRMQGRDLAFVVGGPDGFADEVRQGAHETWSLGPMTLPHPLARLVIIEQLYRAASILANHPYHRGG
ncbi:MAG TPA: 23S rRNA (pseudouridine(1915)-N(3))-methyltransferase RlmH [Xanthomonadaceae bacterium]|nr:23S rRNA (pseudouridine(1915)-N(3))-methyltransferase RlmH [Xanthomonadaceae bacterium]